MNEEERIVEKVQSDLRHIQRNLSNRQYLNAATWAANMVPDLLRLFGIAKRGTNE